MAGIAERARLAFEAKHDPDRYLGVQVVQPEDGAASNGHPPGSDVEVYLRVAAYMERGLSREDSFVSAAGEFRKSALEIEATYCNVKRRRRGRNANRGARPSATAEAVFDRVTALRDEGAKAGAAVEAVAQEVGSPKWAVRDRYYAVKKQRERERLESVVAVVAADASRVPPAPVHVALPVAPVIDPLLEATELAADVEELCATLVLEVRMLLSHLQTSAAEAADLRSRLERVSEAVE